MADNRTAVVACAHSADFQASWGALLPTGNPSDMIDGVEATLIDNGMPCVLSRGAETGIAGDEAPADPEANAELLPRGVVFLRTGRAMATDAPNRQSNALPWSEERTA